MKKEIAAEVSRLAQEASGVLNRSVAAVEAVASERATSVYRSAIGRVMGEAAIALLFPIWREHPDLEPSEMKEPGGYDPSEFKLPPAAVQEALEALSAAGALLEQAKGTLEREPDVEERRAYLSGLQSVVAEVANAVKGVERRRA